DGLSRNAERDEALADLERLLGEPPAAPEADRKPEANGASSREAAPAAREIVFPDGLRVPFDAARAMLSADQAPRPPRAPAAAPTPDRNGLQVAWVFETGDRSPITCVLAAGEDRLVVADQQGTIYWIDRRTGKLLRASESALAAATPGRSQVQYQMGNTYSSEEVEVQAPLPAAATGGRVFAPSAQEVRCLEPDGGVAWTARPEPAASETAAWPPGVSFNPAGQGLPPSFENPLLVFLDGTRLLTFNSRSGTAAAFSCRNGKLLWQWQLPPGPASVPGMQFTGGATASDGRLFVYGSTGALLDSATGRVIWSLDPARARTFPFRLEDPEAAAAETPAPPPAPAFPSFAMGR